MQLLLGHSKIESTVRYLGIAVDVAIEIAEKIDIRQPIHPHERTWSASVQEPPTTASEWQLLGPCCRCHA